MEKIIEVNHITKRFKDKAAVNDVSFSIEKGTVTAILGPNGAGKTTMITMMLGLLSPTEGKARMLGKNPKAVRNRLGAMLQEVSVMDGVTVGETIDLFRSYYEAPLPKNELLRLADLEAEEKKMADGLSGGQKRRLGFALALAGNPDILFLDEPTVGMDITSRKHFWDEIRQFARLGKTIILTTHYLEEADQLANRIMLFANGTIACDGTPEEIKARITKKSVTFTMSKPIPASLLAAIPHVKGAVVEGTRVSLVTNDTDAVLRAIFEEKLNVHDIDVERGRLDEAFEQIVSQAKEEII
ncbi:ATP-binding cassette domain-containing protein [Ectobacillus polymachus]|uniref:ABC transporter ATP-binding protein n=1 Tax=Ectobacillus polymachus TaxID=1508806 RepID=UPI003A8BDF95